MPIQTKYAIQNHGTKYNPGSQFIISVFVRFCKSKKLSEAQKKSNDYLKTNSFILFSKEELENN